MLNTQPLNDKTTYILADKIMNLEEYFSIEDYGNLLMVQTCIQTNKAMDFLLNSKIYMTPSKEITPTTLRVNFEVDKNQKEVFIEKTVLNKVYAFCKIYSENNNFIKIITNRVEKFDTNDILKKINELKIFRGPILYQLKIKEFPISTYYLEEKPEINKDNNSEDIEKEFILKKINNIPNNNNQNNYLNDNKNVINSYESTMVVNKITNQNYSNNNIRKTYDSNHSYQNNNINNGIQNNNNNNLGNIYNMNQNNNQINFNQNFCNINNNNFHQNNNKYYFMYMINQNISQNNNLLQQILSYIRINNNNPINNNILQNIQNLIQINNSIQNNQINMNLMIQKTKSLIHELNQIINNNMNQNNNNNINLINNNNNNQNIQNNNCNMNNQLNNNNNQMSNYLQPIINYLNQINYNMNLLNNNMNLMNNNMNLMNNNMNLMNNNMNLMNNDFGNFNNSNHATNNNIIDNNSNNNDDDKKNPKVNFKLIQCEEYFPLIGLRNVGLTCYMNCILQCLLHIPELNSFFINTYSEHKNKLKKINKDTETGGRLCEEYYKIVKEIESLKNQNNSYIKPKDFNKFLSNTNGQFAQLEANDAKDLLLYLFQAMHSELNYFGDKKLKNVPKCNQLIEEESFNFFMTVNNNLNLSIISYLFYGIHKSSTLCQGCNQILYNFQYFQFLSFPTFNYKDEKFNIYQGFKDFVKPEVMTGDNKCYCQNCKGLRDAKVTTKIFFAPPYLIINIDYGKNKKFKPKIIDFGGFIDITDFVDKRNKSENIEYKLIAVCTHIGKSGSTGHYITYCLSYYNQWYVFNDSSVSETDFDNIKSNSPYVLIYKKLDKKNN